MNPYCVEFSDGVVWVGMAEDAKMASEVACAYWRARSDNRGVPTFSVYTLEVIDDE